ncbi:MAG: MarR family transcriptional regulator [Nitrospiraceae bacterium]|nr:MarR family transcriptional regulator [Nitrospiraceae bacterium]
MDATQKLINLFFMTHRSLHKHMQESRLISAFSLLQFMTMKFIGDEGPVNMKDVARFFSITPASATSLVSGLVHGGMLERIADPKDRRIIRLAQTAKGRKKLDSVDNQVKAELRRIFLHLREGERSSLLAVLERLHAILEREKAPGAPRRAVPAAAVRKTRRRTAP